MEDLLHTFDLFSLADEHLPSNRQTNLLCPECREHLSNVVFSCGHVTCDRCAKQLVQCPICHKPILMRTTLFLWNWKSDTQKRARQNTYTFFTTIYLNSDNSHPTFYWQTDTHSKCTFPWNKGMSSFLSLCLSSTSQINLAARYEVCFWRFVRYFAAQGYCSVTAVCVEISPKRHCRLVYAIKYALEKLQSGTQCRKSFVSRMHNMLYFYFILFV